MHVQQVVIAGQRQVELQNFDLSENNLRENELLIESECSFISAGTETANYAGIEPAVFQPGSWCAYPWRPGYANVGVVRAAGARYQSLIGHRVFTNGPHASAFRYQTDGLYKPVALVPDGLASDEAVATRMAMIAMTAVDAAETGPMGWVVVFGLGMVGNLAAQLFRLTGASVIGVDPSAARRKLAASCGISHELSGSEEEVREEIHRLTGGHMARLVVDAVGHSAVAVQALRLLAKGGEGILLGSPRAPVPGDLTEMLALVHHRSLVLKGALEWVVPTDSVVEHDYTQQKKLAGLFRWIADGRLQIRPLLTQKLPPHEIKTAYEGLLNRKDDYIGVVLKWK